MRRVRPSAAAGAGVLAAVLACCALVGVGLAGPALADVRDVRLTQGGPVPAQLQVSPGDVVRFVNADTFVHRAVSDSSGWAFDTGRLVPGATFTVDPALTRAGTYSYRGSDLDTFTGTVVVPGEAAAPASTPSPSRPAAAPSRRASPAPSARPQPAGAATPAPSASGSPAPGPGAGAVPPPGFVPAPFDGGTLGDAPPAAPAPGAPAPQVAPGAAPPVAVGGPAPVPLPGSTASGGGPAAPVLGAGRAARLASPVEARRYGLPVALALVAVGGVLSLLLRVLLAEPSARPPAPGPAGPSAAGTGPAGPPLATS